MERSTSVAFINKNLFNIYDIDANKILICSSQKAHLNILLGIMMRCHQTMMYKISGYVKHVDSNKTCLLRRLLKLLIISYQEGILKYGKELKIKTKIKSYGDNENITFKAKIILKQSWKNVNIK